MAEISEKAKLEIAKDEKGQQGNALDEALKNTFPASDPVALVPPKRGQEKETEKPINIGLNQ